MSFRGTRKAARKVTGYGGGEDTPKLEFMSFYNIDLVTIDGKPQKNGRLPW
jgi:hypothetical protein